MLAQRKRAAACSVNWPRWRRRRNDMQITMTTAPPLSAQRAAIGLKTPSWKAKKLIWRHVKSPTAGIADGYRPIGKAKDAHGADVRGKAISGGWRSGKSLTAGMEGLAWLPY